ncbi:hypothetical protein [Ectobacillus sp. sgz5001026]
MEMVLSLPSSFQEIARYWNPVKSEIQRRAISYVSYYLGWLADSAFR